MNIQQNISLKPYNSFGIEARAAFFASFHSLDELHELTIHHKQHRLLILGGGSNLLFTKDFDGLVLRNKLNGIELIGEDADHYYVEAAAGENWHRFVQYCVGHNYNGLENLSLIPGNVGASPMQNIGAYGIEIKDVFYSLEAYHLEDGSVHTFYLKDCDFGYRESVFKGKLRNRFVILSVTYQLRKKPIFNTSYGAIEQELAKMEITEFSAKAISDAVIRIRSSKLPDPVITGNAGSFFKNPVITQEQFDELKKIYPAIAGFSMGATHMKVAAGWLIEQCGWKGYRKGDAGCYDKQALVLVNYGNASGKEIMDLSDLIIESVSAKFAIRLVREVNIV